MDTFSKVTIITFLAVASWFPVAIVAKFVFPLFVG